MKKPKIAVVGATGAVGRAFFEAWKDRKLRPIELVPFASPRSEGKEIVFQNHAYRCQVLKKGCFEGVDIVFFDVSDELSREWVHQAASEGAWVIDNSAAYRMDPKVPLIVPEINGSIVDERLAKKDSLPAEDRIFAGPNCSTVQLVVALKPILDKWGLKRVVVSTYQSTSGGGTMAIQELEDQTRVVLEGGTPQASAFAHPIPFNLLPQIGGEGEDGYTSEELKMMRETKKIMDLPNLKITATAVRVPTRITHGESVNIETEKPFELEEVRQALGSFEGLILQDDLSKKEYPICEGPKGAGHREGVYVGRVRRDLSLDNGLNLWVVADNLRKGAASNGIQIAERLLVNF